ANPGYTYTNPANGAVLSGYVAANQATTDMANAVNAAGIGGTPILGWSSATGVPASDTTTQLGAPYVNINPGDVALAEPDYAAFTAAQDAGQSLSRSSTQYVVTNVGGANAGSLLDAVLDAQYVYGFYGAAGGAVTAPATYLAAATGATNSPAALFNADGSLAAAGAAYANLSAIIAAGSGGSAAGSSLSVGLAPAETGVQYAQQLLVFAGPGGSDNIVVWGDTEGPSGGGHGPSVLSFGAVQSSVTVFDPTLGTGAVATYANISELDIANTPDGPLVVQVSGVTGSGSGAAATYAGANGGVYVVANASGATYTTPINGAAVVDSSGTANDVINSRGTDTISTGGGTDVVYASGAAATVTGGSGTLIFVAGNGNYNAGGGSSTAILYGGGGADTLTGATGAGSILVAGTGNTTLSGGGGNSAVMFGGTGATSFFGSGGGHDTMVGGTGNNTFTTTNGDIVFGGTANDSFNLTGGEIVVEGAGADTVTLYAGASTVFGGTGATGFVAATGSGVNASLIGFSAADHLTLVGASGAAVSNAVAGATTGSYGTMLSLADGTRLTLFGVAALDASQVSAG
ncbi:MAG: beta strand repeat-containing protein, partial [Janthinobacterium lividum]